MYWFWAELTQSPGDFFQEYAHDAPLMIVPYAISLHDGEIAFVQIIALAVLLVASLIVIIQLVRKRPGEND